jgi:hypothetical protein
MLVTPPFGASSNIALLRANNKPPVELVVANLESMILRVFTLKGGNPFIM